MKLLWGLQTQGVIGSSAKRPNGQVRWLYDDKMRNKPCDQIQKPPARPIPRESPRLSGNKRVSSRRRSDKLRLYALHSSLLSTVLGKRSLQASPAGSRMDSGYASIVGGPKASGRSQHVKPIVPKRVVTPRPTLVVGIPLR
jgi:hypothetical protein